MTERQLAIKIKKNLEDNRLTFIKYQWNGTELRMFFQLDNDKFIVKVSKDE